MISDFVRNSYGESWDIFWKNMSLGSEPLRLSSKNNEF